MFSNMGDYEPCGIFTTGHFILLTVTIICIILALKFTYRKNKEDVYKIIKNLTIIICILEIIKIVFSIYQGSFADVNSYVPLYYCSILLYAGILSSFGKGNLKKAGDVCLATGSITGGIVFLIYPSTSLPMYPAFHFLSIHSLFFHGTMVYLGILINITNYVELKLSDAKYFAIIIAIMSILALIVNKISNGNLMFISHNFPGTPIEIIYNLTNGSIWYSFIMIVVQMTLPFYFSYFVIKMINQKYNFPIL